MKKVLKFLFALLEIVIIIYAVGVTTLLLCRNNFGYSQLGKNTLVTINEDNEDYLSKFNLKDLIIIKEVKFDDVNAGDEVYYYVPEGKEYAIKSGIVQSKVGDKESAVYTFVEEDGDSIASERIIGKLESNHSNIGGILELLESRVGFLLLVILPIMILFIYQIYNLIVSLKYDKK